MNKGYFGWTIYFKHMDDEIVTLKTKQKSLILE